MIGAGKKRRPRRELAHSIALGALVIAFGSVDRMARAIDAPPNATGEASAAQAYADVVVLFASRADGGGSIDPRIDPKLPLQEPPFSSYNTYRLLSKTSVPLKKGIATKSTLPNGRSLEMTLKDIVGEKRYRVATRITDAGGAAFLPSLEVTAGNGESFFVAGQVYEDGVLFVGMTLMTPAPR